MENEKSQMMRTDDFHDRFSENRENRMILLNKAIYLEWKKFITGDGVIDTEIVSRATLDEWTRCRALSIDPFGIPGNDILTNDALQEKLDQNKSFIGISQPFLHKLFRSLKGFSYAVALLDGDGYMLKDIAAGNGVAFHKTVNFVPGSRWNYENAGNCASACILENKKPRQVIGAHHYLHCLRFISASGAPIVDPDGMLLGCLAVTTFYLSTQPQTLGLAMAVAHAIAHEWRSQKTLVQCRAAFEQTDIVSSLQKALVSSISEALIVINNEGRVMTVNEKARDMFGLPNKTIADMTLGSIFSGRENRSFLAAVQKQDAVRDLEVRIRTLQGTAHYMLTSNSIALADGAAHGKMLVISKSRKNMSMAARAIHARAKFTFKDICCHNNEFKNVIDQARGFSQSSSNVLLLGESGTGKDILAQAIHNSSPRQDGPYIAINCAAIPRELIASELFGHAEGAFTGSRRGGRPGKFELADGGTIFLDEIAEMSLEIQAVFLRVIEDKCVVRVGGSQICATDVRIISATNRDLLAEVNRGNFRRDLFYRLNVFNIQVPPLRERLDDIPLLTKHFIQKFAKEQGKAIRGANEKVIGMFMNYRWPGNVRELQNVVERMVNFATSDQLTVDLVPPEIIDTRQVKKISLDFEHPSEKEKRLIRHMLTLKLSKGNIARQLDMSRSTLYRKMRKYGLPNTDERESAQE